MNDGLSANNTIIESRVRGPVLKASDTIRHAAEVLAGYGQHYWTYFFWANSVPADDPFKQECCRFYRRVVVSPPRGRASLYSLHGVQYSTHPGLSITSHDYPVALVTVSLGDLAASAEAYLKSVLRPLSSYVAPVVVS